MPRVYIAVPVDPSRAAGALASVAKAHRESPEEASERGYTGPPCILRLRDRTGPSVAARLAALEASIGEPVCVGCGGNVGHHKAPDGGGCSGWFPTVREHLARLETEHAALVVRVGELERLPVATTEEPAPVRPEPGSTSWQRVKAIQAIDDGERGEAATREQIEERLRSRPDQWREGDEPGLWLCDDEGYYLGAASDRAALVKRLGLAASSTTAEDPDWLAKVAHRAADKLTTWGNLHEPTRDIYRAIATAIADACAEDRVASMGAAVNAAYAEHRGDLLARAEKAEGDAEKQYQATWDALRPYNDTRDPEEIGDLVADIGTLVSDWQKRGEELEALKGQRAEDMRRSAGADGARLSEAVMAAELREAGWTPSAVTGRWYPPIGSAMRVACPVCFACEGKLCTKHDGTTMLRCHRERHDKAARVDTLKAYRQAKGAR